MYTLRLVQDSNSLIHLSATCVSYILKLQSKYAHDMKFLLSSRLHYVFQFQGGRYCINTAEMIQYQISTLLR